MNQIILNKAIELEKEIKKLDEVLLVFDVTQRAFNEVDSSIIIKKKIEIELLGRRYFGHGSHSTAITLPKSTFEEITKLFKAKKEILEKEFKELGNEKKN